MDDSETVPPDVADKYEFERRYKCSYPVRERATSRFCVVKRVYKLFGDKDTTRDAYKELRTFIHLGSHENIAGLIEYILPRNFPDLFIVYESLPVNLCSVIRECVLEPIHKQYIIYQLFKALLWIHSAGLIHNKVKSDNVVIDETCTIKLCSFENIDGVGIPRPSPYEPLARWFAAPELLLECSHVTSGIDVWGVGCILGGMLRGEPMFQGTTTLNTLEIILSFTGPPTQEALSVLEGKLGNILEALHPPVTDWTSRFPKATSDALDLLHCMLDLNPLKRPSSFEALAHPYLSEFSDPASEPIHSLQVHLLYSTTVSLENPEHAAAFVPRCGARSPARCLPPALAAYEIGRPWVVPRDPAAAVVLRLQFHRLPGVDDCFVYYDCSLHMDGKLGFDRCWVVTFSHTGGVLAMEQWRHRTRCLGWISPNLAVARDNTNSAMAVFDCRNAVEPAIMCQLPEMDTMASFATTSGQYISIRLDFSFLFCHKMVRYLLRVAVPSRIDGGLCRSLGVNFTEGGDDEAILRTTSENVLWLVDIRETYSSGTLCIKERRRGFRRLAYKVFCSELHKMIAPMYQPPYKQPSFELRAIEPDRRKHKILRQCRSEPHKVDTHHFVEVTHRNHRLEVFSTDDMEHPCNVIHNTTRISFVCGGGLIAFLDENDRIDLVDAVSGTLVLSWPVPSDFEQETFTMWVVGAH
ncbi:extracellular response kinase [Pelomyxa schiedti]|nr:extracellular response kinase [Pelomyxa schiedti]